LRASLLISKVLVAVDGSNYSDRTFDFALDFAEKFGAALTVLNVSEAVVMSAVPQETVAYPSSSTSVVAKDLRAIQNEIISKYIDHARVVKPNLLVSSLAKAGDAAVEIVDTANEGSFDVTVVGHHGLGKAKERFLGSVSEKVAHSASCTVMIVK
jgi:nucleotide-binding universal stress UspA family protein